MNRRTIIEREKVKLMKTDRKWFRHDRFGMFIHWGLYAVPGRHEWIKNLERISDALRHAVTPEDVSGSLRKGKHVQERGAGACR